MCTISTSETNCLVSNVSCLKREKIQNKEDNRKEKIYKRKKTHVYSCHVLPKFALHFSQYLEDVCNIGLVSIVDIVE